jgi:predicted ferric reductase
LTQSRNAASSVHAAPGGTAVPVVIYRVAFVLAAAVAAVLGAFFVIGVADGSVSSFNIGLWAATLAAVAGVLAGGSLLRARGHALLASLLLATLAVPGLLYALFVLLVIASGTRWN